MFDRVLTLSLAAVAIGLLYLGIRGTVAALLFGVRGTALLWRLSRCRRCCPDCRRLGERCPWCDDDARRAMVGALLLVLPVVAWALMLKSPVEFSPRAKWVAGVWAAVWIAVGSRLLQAGVIG
jgi:hypothetical protein